MRELTNQTIIYRRETIETLNPTKFKSLQYWRKQAKDLFEANNDTNMVEVVLSGNKLDSQILTRGQTKTPFGIVVVIASTGGKWGKSKRVFDYE